MTMLEFGNALSIVVAGLVMGGSILGIILIVKGWVSDE